MRSPSLHPTSSSQRCPSGHPASYGFAPEFIDVPPIGLRCELCLSKEAKYKCSRCGRWVCEAHYDHKRGMCTLCASSTCSICLSNLGTTHCAFCGRIVCPRCSMDIDSVRRICFICIISRGSISLLSKVVESRSAHGERHGDRGNVTNRG